MSQRTPDAATAAYLKAVNAVVAPPFDSLEPVALRAAVRNGRAAIAPPTIELQSVRDIARSGAAPAMRVYRPAKGELPALIYFCGGGWVLGDLDTHDGLCRSLAQESGCVVIAVDYRKAPEHPFPAAVEDAIAGLRWVASHAADLGIDAKRLAIGGDSAGANIASVATMTLHATGGPRFVWQLMLYPLVDRPSTTGSYAEFGRGHSLTADALAWFFDKYAPAAAAAGIPDWWLTPIDAPGLSNLPATLVIVAGCDPLRDEGTEFARRLADRGVAAELIEFEDQIHGFANCGDAFPRAAEVRSLAAARMAAALSR